MYICMCNAVTERQIEQAIHEGACSLQCLQAKLGIATQCGKCAYQAVQMLAAGSSNDLQVHMRPTTNSKTSSAALKATV